MAAEYCLPESSYPRAISLLQQASSALVFMNLEALGSVEQQHIRDLATTLRTQCSKTIMALGPAHEAGVETEFVEPAQSDSAVA